MGGGRGLSGGLACIKYLMFSFNLIFWLIGLALTGFGIWVLVDDTFKDLAADTNFAVLQYAGIGCMAVGFIIMICGFFGCCGAIKESRCLLSVFFVCMFILFGGLVGAGVICIINKDLFADNLVTQFERGVMAYDEKDSDMVNIVQEVFDCCGATDYQVEYSDFMSQNDRLPMTCPHLLTNPRQVIAGTPTCKDKINEIFTEYGLVLGGVLLGAGSIMLIGMIFSMLLCCAIRETFE